ncbi:hypothetical protein K469DRAFT_748326 [Zopfia rhizophila CBS 207.26]|uniref:FAD-binding domain-containing protein n=1 Tax=Zopfia rhizophila CBS 207.26 TaxID=1314779 RepID=A0A6A6E962_9PEZI|nr:hypothetical protein K469DRAFT_748326 [Zopfia rhizophila CBS 207.26]
MLAQDKFQEILLGTVREQEKAEVKMGWGVEGFEDRGYGSVVIKIVGIETGKEEEVKAACLIGADGAKSTVRKLMGFSLEGKTLDVQLVATDMIYDFAAQGFFDGSFIIDENDYGLIGRIDRGGFGGLRMVFRKICLRKRFGSACMRNWRRCCQGQGRWSMRLREWHGTRGNNAVLRLSGRGGLDWWAMPHIASVSRAEWPTQERLQTYWNP